MSDFAGLRYVLIVCHSRTGGTWLGTLLDTCKNVKYLWEPDAALARGGDNIFNWDIDDAEDFRSRTLSFKPHCKIEPSFAKGPIDTAVAKLIAVHGLPAIWARRIPVSPWVFRAFRERLNAKVLHLVRHPVRWAASIMRWAARNEPQMKAILDFYTDTSLHFHGQHKHEDWYRLVNHDDLTVDTADEIADILDFCGLEASDDLRAFLGTTHSVNGSRDPNAHATTMTRNAVLNGWKAGLSPAVAEYASQLAVERWEGLYESLV